MVDIETHRIIDLLASRETEHVAEWLKTYPNLSIVSRDGSVSYGAAIRQANENILQISDRFHLLKGFTDAAKKFLSRFLPPSFCLPTEAPNGEEKEEPPAYWKRKSGNDRAEKKHQEVLEKKQSVLKRVKELKQVGLNNTEIAKEVGVSRQTVGRYLKPGYNPTSARYHTTYSSKIKPYAQDIKRLLSEGKTFHQISAYIQEKGYDGADSTVKMYATKERMRMKEAEVGTGEKLERRYLVSLLYRQVDEIKGISQEHLDKVTNQYPIIGKLYAAGENLKEMLCGGKPADLEKWMAESRQLEIEEISCFINGIQRDMDAVKNAIHFDYNNGLAEGSVNKLKVVKRIMYGRNSFELLKAKVLRLESKRKIN